MTTMQAAEMRGQLTPVARNSTAPMSVQSGQMSIGGSQIGRVGDLTPYQWWWPQNQYTYISGATWTARPNPTETAFKVVAKMLEDGLVGELTVAQFVKLVDDIATIVKES